MSVIINELKIISNGSQMLIDVETNVGYNISSILLWTMSTFKDYTLAKNLTPYLLQVDNTESLTINSIDIGIPIFEDICFIEVHSTYIDPLGCQDCQAPALGVTYNLAPYYTCLLGYLTDLAISPGSLNDNRANQIVITINMLIDNIIKDRIASLFFLNFFARFCL